MAPEALEGQPYDGRPADVWALGVALFNLLSRGEFPFHARDDASLRAAIRQSAPALERLSAGARELLENMLAKRPSARLAIHQVREQPRLLPCMHVLITAPSPARRCASIRGSPRARAE